jgi:phosphoribosylamine--glycine ligase
VRPLVDGLQVEGLDYRGFLFLGLMMTPAGPQVLEFNCRLGDPEAQVLLPGLESDFVDLCEAIVTGTLARHRPLFDRRYRMGVVACAPGYPHAVVGGAPIHGLEEAAGMPDVTVYHGGTAVEAAGETVVAGGRVVTVVGTGRSLEAARTRAYEAIDRIWLGRSRPHFRTDIGFRALTMGVMP